MEAKTDDRKKLLYVGPPGAGAIVKARELTATCQHWRGREAEQGFAYRVAGVPIGSAMFSPLRAPHHTVSRAAMEGLQRGHIWRPGEVHLAHGGVLFLDLVSEFKLDVLVAVASAWQEGYTHHASRTVEGVQGAAAHELNHLYVPTYFSLVMATTPCPCGWRGVAGHECKCTERSVERWFERIRVLSEGAERIELKQRPVYPCLECDQAPAVFFARGNEAKWCHVCEGCWVVFPASEQALYARESAS
jgi:magnesium chelatase family protein